VFYLKHSQNFVNYLTKKGKLQLQVLFGISIHCLQHNQLLIFNWFSLVFACVSLYDKLAKKQNKTQYIYKAMNDYNHYTLNDWTWCMNDMNKHCSNTNRQHRAAFIGMIWSELLCLWGLKRGKDLFSAGVWCGLQIDLENREVRVLQKTDQHWAPLTPSRKRDSVSYWMIFSNV